MAYLRDPYVIGTMRRLIGRMIVLAPRQEWVPTSVNVRLFLTMWMVTCYPETVFESMFFAWLYPGVVFYWESQKLYILMKVQNLLIIVLFNY